LYENSCTLKSPIGSICYPYVRVPPTAGSRTASANCPPTALGFRVIQYSLDEVTGLDPTKLTLAQWGNLCLFALNGINGPCTRTWGSPPDTFFLNSPFYPDGWNGTSGTINWSITWTKYWANGMTNLPSDIGISGPGICCVDQVPLTDDSGGITASLL
jgi:hypothetical protein